MLNSTFILKIKERINKLDSLDYDNIEPWKILEAANTAQLLWCRRQLTPLNPLQQGDEQSRRRIEDLQVLLTYLPINTVQRDGYSEADLPLDWFAYKRLDAKGRNECCDPIPMRIWETEEISVPDLLRDENRKPSWEWAETFCTFSDNTLKVWTNNEFAIESAKLVYYRLPRRMRIIGIADAYTQLVSAVDTTLEFKDDICEILVFETVSILAGDMESQFQFQRAAQTADKSN